MPISEVPTNLNQEEPTRLTEPAQLDASGAESNPQALSGEPPVVRGSRWVDYDTHELLEMISELEDERRWARLREGIWIAVLFHLALLSAVTWIPKYVFKVPQVIDPIDAIKDRKDLSYLDLPPDALRQIQPKVKVKPTQPAHQPTIDKKTLEAMNRAAPPAAPAPTPPPQPAAPATPPPVPAPGSAQSANSVAT